MRIVVAGAGISGLAIAKALLERGHDVAVLEADSALRQGGAGISIWANGHAALDRLGLSLPDRGQRVETLRVLHASGRQMYLIDVARIEERLGYETRLLRRRDLVQHLYEQLPAGVVRFGAEVAMLDFSSQVAVRAVTSAGDGFDANLVVGADGHRSAVRRYIYDTGPAIPTGLVTWQGVHPVEVEIGHPGESLYIQGDEGWCGLMPAGNGELQWWFDLPAAVADQVPAGDRVGFLRERFAGWPSSVAEVTAHLDGAQIEPWPYTRHPVPRQLYRDRAVLIGDAAHAMPPSMAQGASQSLDDALALVEALDRHTGLTNALGDYQRQRRTRAAAVSWVSSSRFALRGPPQRLAPLNRLVPSRVVTALFARWIRAVSYSLSEAR